MILTDMQTIVLSVPGLPIGQPRQRFDRRTGRNFTPAVIHKNDDGSKSGNLLTAWRHRIYLEALGKVRSAWEGPVVIQARFYFPRPEYMLSAKWPDCPVPHTGRPDLDNLKKVVMDVLSAPTKQKPGRKPKPDDCPKAAIYHDDGQVYSDAGCGKYYVGRGKAPGARIEITLQSLGEGAQLQLGESTGGQA